MLEHDLIDKWVIMVGAFPLFHYTQTINKKVIQGKVNIW